MLGVDERLCVSEGVDVTDAVSLCEAVEVVVRVWLWLDVCEVLGVIDTLEVALVLLLCVCERVCETDADDVALGVRVMDDVALRVEVIDDVSVALGDDDSLGVCDCDGVGD